MENTSLKKSFAPIINKNSQILILGSLPSDKSIALNEYYGNKTNQFWNIISLIFENKKIEFKNYNEKIDFLNKHHIALWDTYCSANRKGSLDSDIKNGEFNNIKELLNEYPIIKKILVNGRKSEIAFQKYIKTVNLDCNYKYVPSSSSANTSLSLFEKVEYWRKVILE